MKRKSVLIAMAAVSLMALVGLGTSAEFADTEVSGNQTFTAGTLDLVLGGSAITTPINVSNLAPGSTQGAPAGTATIDVTNSGSVAGAYLAAVASKVGDLENGCNEPEINNDADAAADPGLDDAAASCGNPGAGEGELDDNLQIELLDGATSIFTGTVSALHGTSFTVAGGLAAGQTKTLTINWWLPAAATNIVQSDGTSFTLAFDLEQTAPGNTP